MAPSSPGEFRGAQSRVAGLLARGKGVRGAVHALVREALAGAPAAPARVLDVARAIRAGIAGASGIGNAEAREATEEALGGLQAALDEQFAALAEPSVIDERRRALEAAESLQREFGAASRPLGDYIGRLRATIGRA